MERLGWLEHVPGSPNNLCSKESLSWAGSEEGSCCSVLFHTVDCSLDVGLYCGHIWSTICLRLSKFWRIHPTYPCCRSPCPCRAQSAGGRTSAGCCTAYGCWSKQRVIQSELGKMISRQTMYLFIYLWHY